MIDGGEGSEVVHGDAEGIDGLCDAVAEGGHVSGVERVVGVVLSGLAPAAHDPDGEEDEGFDVGLDGGYGAGLPGERGAEGGDVAAELRGEVDGAREGRRVGVGVEGGEGWAS